MVTPQAFDAEWRSGDRAIARQMAHDYVSAHAFELSLLLRATLEELVSMVTYFRNAGDDTNRIIVDMVLLANHQPQQITGAADIGGEAAVAMAEAIIAQARSQ